MALLDRFPRKWAFASSDDMDGHGAEFIEREFRAVRERVANLASPEGVGVQSGLVGFIRLERGDI